MDCRMTWYLRMYMGGLSRVELLMCLENKKLAHFFDNSVSHIVYLLAKKILPSMLGKKSNHFFFTEGPITIQTFKISLLNGIHLTR